MESCSLCGSKLIDKAILAGDLDDPNAIGRHATRCFNPPCTSADPAKHDAEWMKVD